MKVKVIMSCDDNPYYLDFWPLVAKVWRERIGYEPVLVHVGDSEVTSEYGQVVNIKPLQDYKIHTQAQLARLWYPQFESDVLWITSDIDMFPISRTYWKQSIHGDYEWCNLNTNLRNYFPLCYNVATGENFKKILDTEESFSDFMEDVTSSFNEKTKHTPENWNGEPMESWGLDEQFVSMVVSSYRDGGGKVYQPLRPDGFHSGRRLDRINWKPEVDKITNDWYVDCHSLRPYNYHKIEIDTLMKMLVVEKENDR